MPAERDDAGRWATVRLALNLPLGFAMSTTGKMIDHYGMEDGCSKRWEGYEYDENTMYEILKESIKIL